MVWGILALGFPAPGPKEWRHHKMLRARSLPWVVQEGSGRTWQRFGYEYYLTVLGS